MGLIQVAVAARVLRFRTLAVAIALSAGGACGSGGRSPDGAGRGGAGGGEAGTAPDAAGGMSGAAGNGAPDAGSDVPVGGGSGTGGGGTGGGGTGGGSGTGGGGTGGGGTGGGTPGPWDQARVCATFGWGQPNAVAFAPDGQSVALAALSVKLFDVATGAIKRTYFGLTNDPTSVAFSPDGTRIAASALANPDSSSFARVAVWKVDDASVVWTRPAGHSVTAIAYSPDGALLAIADYDQTVRLVRASDGTTVSTYSGNQSAVQSVAFSQDGLLVASGDTGGHIKIWRVSDLGTLQTLAGGRSIAFSPDGTQLLTDGVRYLVGDGSVIQSGFATDSGPVAFAPDGLSFFAGSVLYRTRDGARLRNPIGGASAFAYTPDSQKILLVPGIAPGPVLWSTLDGTTGTTVFVGDPIEGAPPALSPDGTRTMIGSRMFKLPGGEPIFQTPFPAGSAVFSLDGTLVLVGGQTLLDAADGTVKKMLNGTTVGGPPVALSPSGTRLVTGSADHLVRVLDFPGLNLLRTLGGIEGHTNVVASVAWSPDETLIASSDGAPIIWRVADGALLHTFPATGMEVAFSPDGSTLRVLGSDVIWNYDVAGYGLLNLTDVPGGQPPVSGEEFAPTGDLVATHGALTGLDLWSLPDGRQLTNLPDPWGVRWTVIGQRGLVASSGDNTGNVTKAVYWCRGESAGGGMGGSGGAGGAGGTGGSVTVAEACNTGLVLSGDFDGDRTPDCISLASGNITFHKGIGGGLVQGNALTSAMGSCANYSGPLHTVADLNGDGRDDIVLGYASNPDEIHMISGRADGHFRCTQPIGTLVKASIRGGAVTADFTGDGRVDVLAVGMATGAPTGALNYPQWVVLSGTIGYSYVTANLTSTGINVQQQGSVLGMASGDFDNDGNVDVALLVNVQAFTGPAPGQEVAIAIGQAGGTPLFSGFVPGTVGATAVVTSDANRDGKLDLLVTLSSVVTTFYGDGTGHFSTTAP